MTQYVVFKLKHLYVKKERNHKYSVKKNNHVKFCMYDYFCCDLCNRLYTYIISSSSVISTC